MIYVNLMTLIVPNYYLSPKSKIQANICHHKQVPVSHYVCYIQIYTAFSEHEKYTSFIANIKRESDHVTQN